MGKIIKVVNRFNGNLCLAGSTDSGDYLFECNPSDGSIVSDKTSKNISDITLNDSNSYLFVAYDNFVGKFEDGIIDDTYLDASIPGLNGIAKSRDGNLYLVSLSNNTLTRLGVWQINLPFVSDHGKAKLLVREFDNTILYYQGDRINVIRDTGTSGELINTLIIDGTQNINLLSESLFLPRHGRARYRWVSSENLDQSSSSSDT